VRVLRYYMRTQHPEEGFPFLSEKVCVRVCSGMILRAGARTRVLWDDFAGRVCVTRERWGEVVASRARPEWRRIECFLAHMRRRTSPLCGWRDTCRKIAMCL
jgi:hypothetical protein